jgi:hypothetical protein
VGSHHSGILGLFCDAQDSITIQEKLEMNEETSNIPEIHAQTEPMRAEFVRVIEFAINQGAEASEFLNA